MMEVEVFVHLVYEKMLRLVVTFNFFIIINLISADDDGHPHEIFLIIRTHINGSGSIYVLSIVPFKHTICLACSDSFFIQIGHTFR